MLDDAVVKCGRQTKWKYVMICLILALVALLGGWAGTVGISPALLLSMPAAVSEGIWSPNDIAVGEKPFTAGNRVYLRQGDRLHVFDENMARLSVQEIPEDGVLKTGEFCICYVSRGREILIPGDLGTVSCRIPGGVDTAAVGREHFAAVTDCSGYLSMVRIFDPLGNETGSVGFSDRVVTGVVFTKNRDQVAALSLGKDGIWRLEKYDSHGGHLRTVELGEEPCLGLLALGEQLVIRREDTLLFCTGDGQLSETQVSFEGGELLHCQTNENFLALAVRRWNGTFLITVSSGAKVLGEVKLPMEIRDMELHGNWIYILDYENLLIYDALCGLRESSHQGARAAFLAATDHGVWLLGMEEQMRLNS